MKTGMKGKVSLKKHSILGASFAVYNGLYAHFQMQNIYGERLRSKHPVTIH